MSSYLITAPDGQKYKVSGEGSEQEALAHVQGMHAPAAPAEKTSDPSEGGGTLSIGPIDTGIHTSQGIDRFLAGAGKTMTDLGRGVKQAAVQAGEATGILQPSLSTLMAGSRTHQLQTEQAEQEEIDSPLMATGAGKAGSIVGGVAAAAPALLVPGANTVAGAGVVGGIYGALQPTTEDGQRLKNTAVGALTGGVAQKVGGKIAQYAEKRLTDRAAKAATEESQNAVRDATLKDARTAGYVVPPATVNSSAVNTVVESVGGKAATALKAALRNQTVTNRLARKEIGLSENAPLTVKTLEAVRSKAGEAYKNVKGAGKIVADDEYVDDLANIAKSVEEVAQDFPEANVGASDDIHKLTDSLLKDSFDSGSAVEYVKQLRKSASGNLSGLAAADPTKKALGLAQRDAAAALEDMVIRHLESTGKGSLATQFDKARQTIAKTYSIEGALNEGSGNVVAGKLANQLKRGKPLSGGLELAARFAQAFPKAAQEVNHSAGVSALDAIVAGVGGATVNPSLFAIPAARIAARGAALSKAGQKLALPSYAPNISTTEMLKLLKRGGKGAALPSAVYATQE